jgi:hypothetical protein
MFVPYIVTVNDLYIRVEWENMKIKNWISIVQKIILLWPVNYMQNFLNIGFYFEVPWESWGFKFFCVHI